MRALTRVRLGRRDIISVRSWSTSAFSRYEMSRLSGSKHGSTST
jgi:hypothetical protein